MATSKKIVDTRKLASKGRHGDTKLRNVGGEISHVNAYEAYLVDNYNKRGEDAVKAMGSGTINPETGRKEYHWTYGDPLNSHHNTWNVATEMDVGIGDLNVAEGLEYLGDRFGLNEFGDWVAGQWGEGPFQGGANQGFGDVNWFNMEGPSPLETQAGGIVTGGIENLQTQYAQYIAEGGFLSQEQALREGKIGRTTQAGLKDLSKVIDTQITGSDLAYSGSAQNTMEEGRKAILEEHKAGMEGSTLVAEKEEADFMGGLRKQLNQMLIDYQGATGEAYGGGTALDELNQLFSKYGSSNV
jgi:hypothetical protein|tara:strand:+ start:14 stop:910 length:897 start_codon:yes stop_codon:yes gene_type:complete